jgi:hypothetical protein
MANRYWVTGGTGNWNSTTNWSTASGGASGASVPSTADAAIFNASSGSGTATLNISPTVQTLTCTGFTGTLAFGTNTISLNSTGAIFTGATTMTVTGTPLIICTNSSATSRTIAPTAVTETNSISFRITAGTGALGLTAGAYRDLDFTDGTNPTGYAGGLTNTAITIYGNFKASTSGMTRTAGTSAYTFAATSGTKTINTAAVVFDNPFTFDGVGGTWQLQSNLILGPSPSGVASIRTCTLTNGTLDLNNYTLTAGLFSSTNSNTRTLAFGTGKIVVTGTNATVYTTSTGTGLTFTGTPVVEITGNGLSGETRSISAPQISVGGTISNSANIYIKAGADTISLGTATRSIRTLDFTGFSGSIAASASPQIYGNLVLATGMTVTGGTNTWTFAATTSQTITTNSVTITNPITFDGVGGTWTMQDNLTLSSTRTLTLTNGTLDLNNKTLTTGIFVGSGSVARSLLTYSVPIIITGNSATVVSFGTTGSLTVDVPPTFNLTSNPVATTGSRVISWGTPSNTAAFPNINVTNGSDTITTSGTTNLRNLTFTSGFTGTFGNLVRNIYGNLTLTSGMSVGSGTGVNTFNGVGSQTITTAGLTLDFPITFDGVGGTWTLQDNLNAGTVSGSGMTLTNGTLNLNSKTITTFSFASTNSNTRTLAFGSTGKLVLTGFNNLPFSGGTSTNATVTGTAPLIQFTYSGGTGQRNITMWVLPESQSISIEVLNNATDIFTIQGISGGYRNIDTTNFNGTLNIANLPKVFGNFTIGLNVISPVTFSGVNPLTFASTSGTKTITSNGKTINGNVTFDGVGGTWTCADALNIDTNTLTMTNGTLKLQAGTTNTVGSFATSGTNQKYLQSSTAGTQATISAASGTNSVSYLTIQDSYAAGGATWLAPFASNNVYGGNNTNWLFGTAYASTIAETSSAADAPSINVNWNMAIAESASGLDAPIGNVNFTLSVTESSSVADANSSALLWNPIDDTQTPNWQNISNPQTPNWQNIDNS